MTHEPHPPHGALPPPPPPRHFPRGAMCGAALILVLAAGVAAGAGGTRIAQNWNPQSVMLLTPAPIGKLQDGTPVAVKGQVAEVFGNKFIVQDDSGRALVDTGPRGENGNAVTKDEAVTVQGRFERGVIHAQVLIHANGTSEAFGPPRPRHPDRGSPDGRRAENGPGFGPGPHRRPPPPPPGADRGPPPPPPVNMAPGALPPPPPPAE